MNIDSHVGLIVPSQKVDEVGLDMDDNPSLVIEQPIPDLVSSMKSQVWSRYLQE